MGGKRPLPLGFFAPAPDFVADLGFAMAVRS
jgi:hypothetical protein